MRVERRGGSTAAAAGNSSSSSSRGCEMWEGKRDCTKMPTPCLHCKTPCNIPASELLLDEALLLNEIAGATKKKDVPLCDA